MNQKGQADIVSYTITFTVLFAVIILIAFVGQTLIDSAHTETGTTAPLPENVWIVVLIATTLILGFLVFRNFLISEQRQLG